MAHVSTVLTNQPLPAGHLATMAGISVDTARKQLKFLRESKQVNAGFGKGGKFMYSLKAIETPVPQVIVTTKNVIDVPSVYGIIIQFDEKAEASIRYTGSICPSEAIDLDGDDVSAPTSQALCRRMKKLIPDVDVKTFDKEWRLALKKGN